MNACEPLADDMRGKTAIASRRMRESFKLRSKKKIPKFPQGISLELGYYIAQRRFDHEIAAVIRIEHIAAKIHLFGPWPCYTFLARPMALLFFDLFCMRRFRI